MSSGPSWDDGERQIIRDHWETEDDGELADRIRIELGIFRSRDAVKSQRIGLELLHSPTRTGKRGRRSVSMTADMMDRLDAQARREGVRPGTLANRIWLEYLDEQDAKRSSAGLDVPEWTETSEHDETAESDEPASGVVYL